MAIDRQTIEKRDFPIARRGYDPEAVDAHLGMLADELQTLERSSRQRSDSLATAASEQVRVIVEAAERAAAEIAKEAEQEARQTRQEAAQDAEHTRGEAAAGAREHVSRTAEAASGMLQRVEAIDSELGTLVETVRSGASRVSADLSLLQSQVGEAVGRPARAAAGAAEPETVSAGAPIAEATLPDEEGEVSEPAGEGDEGARLVALNMALNGTPREETDAYLAENFDLADRSRLLDEVYARVGG